MFFFVLVTDIKYLVHLRELSLNNVAGPGFPNFIFPLCYNLPVSLQELSIQKNGPHWGFDLQHLSQLTKLDISFNKSCSYKLPPSLTELIRFGIFFFHFVSMLVQSLF